MFGEYDDYDPLTPSGRPPMGPHGGPYRDPYRDPYRSPYGGPYRSPYGGPYGGPDPMEGSSEDPRARLAGAPPGIAEAMMREPCNPGRFADQLSGFLTPPGQRSRPVSGAFGASYDPGVDNGPRTPTLFSDELIHGFAAERGIDLPRVELYEDEFLGSRRGDNYSDELSGVYNEDFNERPSLLNEPLPDGMTPTARTTMPRMRHGNSLERNFPGHNDSMPEGTIGYVGRGEASTWGNIGPAMYPAEDVDEEFIRNREADPDWSPLPRYY
ncbi:hypothetical protein LTR36_009804 [Oleoguttula mirabilis]|uniref:Uncharacterized protein n=1 Tax=Oleoguttula mirabilis TaxID=1507867 RepID=A0AAV9J5U7_9PEZI|nr:hypothetical protein LTR36_009804 [Oleoguttula mirabilis]